MAKRVASIEVRKQRGVMTVLFMGQSNRHQKYIQLSLPLKAIRIGDREFKTQLKTAVNETLA